LSESKYAVEAEPAPEVETKKTLVPSPKDVEDSRRLIKEIQKKPSPPEDVEQR
jgi:hypothetical protein